METEQKATIPLHKPDIKEKIFFFLSGLLVSVPFTLFFSEFSNSLCVAMPLIFAQVCSSVIFAPFIEEVAKVFPLFYRHGETEKSLLNLGILVGLGFGVTEFALYVFALGAPLIARVLSDCCCVSFGKQSFCFILKLVLVHTWATRFDCRLSSGVVSLPPNHRNHSRVALTRVIPLRSGLPAYIDMRLGC
jgi:hypothetical protein